MYENFLKRIIDFVIAFFILLFIWPFLVIITLWLHFANKGAGAFFLQERPGKNERIFKVIKFKSMTDERDKNGKLLTDEKRLTSIGSFIRKTSIDELPQLINVLKGNMSLIGPRPLLVKYLPFYTKKEKLRHVVRSGITGLAQINGRNNLSWNHRLKYDSFYATHICFSLDMKILIKTIQNVLKRKDIVEAPSESNDLDIIRSKEQ